MYKNHLPRIMWFPMVLVAASGCGTSAAPEPTPTTQAPPAQASVATARPEGAGYAHALSRSLFRIGQNVTLEIDQPELRRWRGDQGAFALDPTNDWSAAALNATTPAGPYTLDEASQNAAVENYFVTAGIPREQIAGIVNTYHANGSGLVGGPLTAPHLDSINSILKRSVRGIPVPDSYAWAKMRTTGDMDTESVFWPTLDSTVVQAAAKFAASMTDAVAYASYVGKLPPTYKVAGVVIHHTDPSVHATPVAYVSFDATTTDDRTAAMHHFDVNGAEFRMPQEMLAAPATVRPVPHR